MPTGICPVLKTENVQAQANLWNHDASTSLNHKNPQTTDTIQYKLIKIKLTQTALYPTKKLLTTHPVYSSMILPLCDQAVHSIIHSTSPYESTLETIPKTTARNTDL